MKKYRVLAINPGSTSTKIALYDDDEMIFKQDLSHEAEKLEEFRDISEQLPYRTEMVMEALRENNIPIETIDAFSRKRRRINISCWWNI